LVAKEGGGRAAAATASGRRTGSIIPKVQRAAHRGTRGVSRGLAGRCDRRSSIPRAAEPIARFRRPRSLSSIVSIFIPVRAFALAHFPYHPSLIGLARARARVRERARLIGDRESIDAAVCVIS